MPDNRQVVRTEHFELVISEDDKELTVYVQRIDQITKQAIRPLGYILGHNALIMPQTIATRGETIVRLIERFGV